jgi:hypothetical protein
MERLRRGKDSTVLQRIEGEAATDALEALQRGRLGRELKDESAQLERAILDTSTSLKDALAERARAANPVVPKLGIEAIDERQRQAADRWREQRQRRPELTRSTNESSRERTLILPGEPHTRERAARILGPDGREMV